MNQQAQSRVFQQLRVALHLHPLCGAAGRLRCAPGACCAPVTAQRRRDAEPCRQVLTLPQTARCPQGHVGLTKLS